MKYVANTLVLLLAIFVVRAARAQSNGEEEITTATGLKYVVQRKGSGERPVPGDTVYVHYKGTFTDGKQFDSSYGRGKPFEFMLGAGRVIAGWDQAVALMTVGSKFRILVPWNLAYGARGRSGIPSKSDLIFEIELLKIKKGTPLPVFRRADPEKQQTTESGLKWEVLKDSEGVVPKPEQSVKIRFALWNTGGDLIFCTEMSKRFLTGKRSSLQIGPKPEKFLQEASTLMKVGGVYRFEVPPELCWGAQAIGPKLAANSVTVWQLSLEKIVAAPTFRPTPADKLQKMASGLGYEVIKEGTGAQPTLKNTVKVHYTGWLQGGKVFDSSHARDQPATFRVGGVIAGWTEGLQLMKVGGITQFTIPGALAYGPRGKPQAGIGPNATLIFYVELIGIVK